VLTQTAGTVANFVEEISGTITSNKTISGIASLIANVTVSSGVTLTMAATAQVFFRDGVSLTINNGATLIINAGAKLKFGSGASIDNVMLARLLKETALRPANLNYLELNGLILRRGFARSHRNDSSSPRVTVDYCCFTLFCNNWASAV
jgi:hypothetical protein